MTTFLLVISLVLHLFTILWVITFMQKIENKTRSNVEDEKLKQEIEELLVAYTTEMKEENEKLVKILQEKLKSEKYGNKQSTLRNSEENGNMDRTTKKETAFLNQAAKSPVPAVYLGKKIVQPSIDNEYSDYTPPSIEENISEVLYDKSEKTKVLALAQRGHTSDEIAKKLNMGKGEVELLLKFYQ